jgi:hypothetical protein
LREEQVPLKKLILGFLIGVHADFAVKTILLAGDAGTSQAGGLN